MIGLPKRRELHAHWQRACTGKLLFEEADVCELSRQLYDRSGSWLRWSHHLRVLQVD
jgi:hypothetical protein